MASNNFKERLTEVLAQITDLLTAIPKNASSLILSEGHTGFAMVEASPISECPVAETDEDVATLQAGSAVFIDSRTTTLWTNENGSWVSTPYNGQSYFLRPNTLCYSIWSGRVYYCDGFMRMSRVNLTTAAMPT